MSLSRPVKLPLLKLPFLCIKCVIHNSDLFDIIYFATISRKTRRIVKSSNYSLREIDISFGRISSIDLGYTKDENKIIWNFMSGMCAFDDTFVLQRNAQPFRNCRGFKPSGGPYLRSYTAGDILDALKMGIDLMIDVFGCTIGELSVDGNKMLDLFGLGVSSVKILFITDYNPINLNDLKYLLDNIKVTDAYVFFVDIPKEFSCDPQIFKCRQLYFGNKSSADWVTLEILCQFDVSLMNFLYHRFSAEDIVAYITYWFNSENRKLEFVQFEFNNLISHDDFKIDHLNPMPYCEKRRNRCPLTEPWKREDTSSGKDILRQDGLLATFHVKSLCILFYIWHKRFPDTA